MVKCNTYFFYEKPTALVQRQSATILHQSEPLLSSKGEGCLAKDRQRWQLDKRLNIHKG
ncbi:hypothetical protein SD77_0907 [Bacillus badius]|uniref:Mobile element protein n=1 Tax=Bacillus badius TaxID=1455 RepID=A0ABR5AUQ6_BACBA|nr:hypothetical protein SD78_2579 [Bacillus badius]KIL77928.1 hypothetical protein SD77_0907 [Bacillus badius]